VLLDPAQQRDSFCLLLLATLMLLRILTQLPTAVECNVATKLQPVLSYCRTLYAVGSGVMPFWNSSSSSIARYAVLLRLIMLLIIFSQSTTPAVNVTRNVIVAILLHTQIYLSSSFGARGCTRNTFRSSTLFSPSAVWCMYDLLRIMILLIFLNQQHMRSITLET